MLALHLSRRARERFRIDGSLFAYSGRAVLADVAAARRLAESLSRELAQADPALAAAITPGRLFAMGLVHEMLHAAIDRFRREVDPEALRLALDWLTERLGVERLSQTLAAFAREFPPPPVWRGETSIAEYLTGESEGRSHRELLLEEMLLLWLANASPAFAPFRELFDDGALRRETAYPEVVAGLEEFLAGRPGFPAAGTARDSERRPSLFEALRAPALAAPESLAQQLAALEGLQAPAPPAQAARLARGADLLREEERPVFPPGPGPVEVAELSEADLEGPERYSPDTDWMPSLVLVAKNALVWLWQLSRRLGRPITRLDEIPEAELEVLARRGFTGLWLIGLWERSAASRRIKQLCGNPEAAASAYSVSSYTVAAELGGEEALAALAERAARFGIRLACDMVPNHFGIDSPWVLEHPERFLQLPFSPFPSYRFTGPDLSPDPEVGIFLEDHYYDRTDAAVVFRRLDRRTGEVAYLYHGNDGTGTPWNDTAQLDYLLPEVREAVAETILEVAKRFPVIRFDAAMTLARRHVQRLWYPPPGQGGAIPSRAEHGLTQAEFDRAMPEEFWREVVDRVAKEAPGTLLLAEAFWLMEPYFVRTLGMHRVYNSAFMNLLREERNAEYRKLLKGMLAREPEILKRYVNFLNNPDERTAIDQFGAGDKYFGACALLATLPGLPMLGHGQWEGFAERYGMEYARAYADETPDPWIVARHERQITPLLARRRLFAGSEHFRLYDFEKPGGRVDEDVFAFSNREGDEAALVVFHNRPAPTRGRIRRSTPLAEKGEDGRPRRPRRESLAEALAVAIPGGPPLPDIAGLTLPDAAAEPARPNPDAPTPPAEAAELARPNPDAPAAAPPVSADTQTAAPAEPGAGEGATALRGRLLLRCRDASTGFEHLFDPEEIARRGLALTLGPYQCHVFVDFAAVADDLEGRWSALSRTLAGRGVPSLEEALLEPELEPLLAPFRELLDPELIHRFAAAASRAGGDESLLAEVERRLSAFLSAVEEHLLGREAPGEAPLGAADPPVDRPTPAEAAGLRAGRRAHGTDAPTERPAVLARRTRQDLAAAVDLAGRLRKEAAVTTAPEESLPAADTAAAPERPAAADSAAALGAFLAVRLGDPAAWGVLYAQLLLRRLGEVAAAGQPGGRNPGGWLPQAAGEQARAWMDDLLLGKQVAVALRALGLGEEEARGAVLLLKVLVAGKLPPPEAGGQPSRPAAGVEAAGVPFSRDDAAAEPTGVPSAAAGASPPLAAWLADPDVRLALRINRFADATWLHQESLEHLLAWGVLAVALKHGLDSPATAAAHRAALHLAEAARDASYQVEGLLGAAPAPPAHGLSAVAAG